MRHQRLKFRSEFRVVPGNRRAQCAGSLLFIARGERHQILNTGRAPLRTLNFYAPPAYRRDGEPLPRGRK